MPTYSWNEDKNKLLKKTRNINFEQVVKAINNSQVLANLPHPNPKKYPNQHILVIKHNNYVYAIPYVTSKQHWFFKTIYPNRKHTKKYLKKE